MQPANLNSSEHIAPGPAALVIVFVTALMDSIGFGIMLPVLPELLMEVNGRDLAAAAQIGGMLMVIYAAI